MGSASGSSATSTALRVVDEEGNESRSVLYSSKAPKNDSSRDVVRRGGVCGCTMNTAARRAALRGQALRRSAFHFIFSDYNFYTLNFL